MYGHNLSWPPIIILFSMDPYAKSTLLPSAQQALELLGSVAGQSHQTISSKYSRVIVGEIKNEQHFTVTCSNIHHKLYYCSAQGRRVQRLSTTHCDCDCSSIVIAPGNQIKLSNLGHFESVLITESRIVTS